MSNKLKTSLSVLLSASPLPQFKRKKNLKTTENVKDDSSGHKSVTGLTTILTHGHFRITSSPIFRNSKSSNCGRDPNYPEKTHKERP